jgi:hypothetical protein
MTGGTNQAFPRLGQETALGTRASETLSFIGDRKIVDGKRMTKRTTSKPKLSLIAVAEVETPLTTPATLGQAGADLWRAIVAQFVFDDPGFIEILRQACYAIDRADRCRQAIDKDGEMIRTKGGMRSHPLLRDELQNRALGARLIAKLGLDLEPARAAGRPGGGMGLA